MAASQRRNPRRDLQHDRHGGRRARSPTWKKKFGVTAAAPVAVAAAGGAAAAAAPAAEEQTEFTVTLTDFRRDKKVGVIKVIRESPASA